VCDHGIRPRPVHTLFQAEGFAIRASPVNDIKGTIGKVKFIF
jgi:hypothetical protein